MNTAPYSNSIAGINLVKNMLIPQKNAWLTEIFKSTVARMGQRYAQDKDPVIDFALMDFAKVIIPKFDFYSMEEIESIMVLGATGELGDNIAISSRTITTWFRNYASNYRPKIASKYADDTTKAHQKQLDAPMPVKSTREDIIEHLREVYDDYHNGNMIHSRSYDLAVKFDVIPEKYHDLEPMKIRAKSILAEEKGKELSKGTITRTAYLQAINTVADGTPLDQAMKRVALSDWFSMMKLGKGFQVKELQQ